jgi:glycerate kinase
MKIICAPDSFKGSLSAVDASQAMARGILSVLPDAAIDRCPIGDGGEGTLAALLFAIGGRTVSVPVTGLYGGATEAPFGQFGHDDLVYVEAATVIGLGNLPVEQRRVMAASSFGVGQLIVRAAATSVRQIMVGVGGSATNDGGCGMAQALGVEFYDESDHVIREPISGAMLGGIRRIKRPALSPLRADIPIVVACDVMNPLTGAKGAARVYGPQKGASPEQVEILDAGLANLAALIKRDLGLDVANLPGAGAAGGLGAGLVAFAGAKLVSGIETVLATVGFDKRVQDADICLTGEGRLDAQSLAGKACIGVAKAAARRSVPTVALVGSVGPGAERCRAAGIDEYVSISEGIAPDVAMRDAATLLARAAARLAGKYRGKSDTLVC